MENKAAETQIYSPINLPVNILQAAILFAGKQDIRFYLCSIALNQGHIVATDGHRMFWYPHAELGDLSLIIPRDVILNVIAKWKKVPSKVRPVYVQLSRSSKDHWLINIIGGGSELFAAMDCKYPDWKRVLHGNPIPAESDKRESSTVSYNWNYLADAQKASSLIGGETPILLHKDQGHAGHLIFNSESYPAAKGLIMPLRN